MRHRTRFHPLIANVALRTVLGLALAMGSAWLAMEWRGDDGRRAAALPFFALVFWLPAWIFTDKYVHKYPQRYDTYLIASHFKAAMVMAAIALPLWLLDWMPMSAGSLWTALGLFVLLDYALSLPRRAAGAVESASAVVPVAPVPAASAPTELADIDLSAALATAGAALAPDAVDLLRAEIGQRDGGPSTAVVMDDLDTAPPAPAGSAALLIGTMPLNNVDRLNNYLKHATSLLAMGGYALYKYEAMETVLESLKQRPVAYFSHFVRYRALPKIPYLEKIYFVPPFVWFDAIAGKTRRNRALPKAEVWGRLAYYGIEVMAEKDSGSSTLLLARRVSEPVANRKPSFFAIVALEKVGLDGKVIRLHKVRSMYPFSEFLQKKIFQSHGLSNTGKFRNDFRLTDYGPMIRRRWIDEIPGLYDWMRGDVKLVGMRATSPHFLSLYPAALQALYKQVKPGLVPPIFDEKTTGFDQIAEIEQAYLARYLESPMKTDLLYFWYTFRDIFIRKVRSS